MEENTNMPFSRALRIKEMNYNIVNLLKKLYPKVSCSLTYSNPFEILIATILSAQCTDERVNKVTPELFRRYPTASEMAAADLNDIKRIIKSTGFYNHKAEAIKESSKIIAEKYNNEVPSTMEKLLELKGVARKTANVVLSNGFQIAAGIVVDTHVKRLSFRMGFSKYKDPLKIEKDLMKKIDKKDWIWFSHALIAHGRSVCMARNPNCVSCKLNRSCPKNGVKQKG
jgi:endonuclease-3